MQAMIFAAGLGTRLKPFTDTTPKALLPLAGKTLLQHQIEKLREAGIDDIIVNVHHFSDQIISYLQEHNGFGCSITISDERKCLLETGGGLRKAWSGQEPILACNVDILSNINIKHLIAAYEQEAQSQLVVSERQTQRYLCFNDGQLSGWTNLSTGEIKGHDGLRYAFSGMQVLSPAIYPYLKVIEQEKFSLIDLYLSICQKEILKAYIPEDYRMMDVGKISQLAEAEAFAETLKV